MLALRARSAGAIRALAIPLAVLTVVVAAPAAHAAGATVEVFGGWQDLQFSRQSLGNAVAGREGTAIFGADLMLNLSGLGLGASIDKTVSGTAEPWAGSLMAGFITDMLPIRIELLGELGRRGGAFGDVFNSDGATVVGLRPGVSFGLAAVPLRIGASGLVRWNTSGGSPDYGIVGRVGVDL